MTAQTKTTRKNMDLLTGMKVHQFLQANLVLLVNHEDPTKRIVRYSRPELDDAAVAELLGVDSPNSVSNVRTTYFGLLNRKMAGPPGSKHQVTMEAFLSLEARVAHLEKELGVKLP
jgi:hypothetical protein